MTTDRRRLAALRCLTAAASFAVTIGLFEAALAVAGLPHEEAGWSPADDARVQSDPRIYEPDEKLLWRMRRDAVVYVPEQGLGGVRTNARGLRGPDRTSEFAASRLRVVCLGDSVTFGIALDETDTFPSHAERALRERMPDAAPVVLNAGIPGYSTTQGLRLLDELTPLAPDVVVWWFGMNDAKPALGAADSSLRGGAPAVETRPGWLRALRTVRWAESLGTALHRAPARVSLDESRAAVSSLAARAAAGGPVTVFVRCPSRLGEKLAQLEEIAAAADAAGAAFVEGSADALSEVVPGPRGSTRVVRTQSREDETIAVLGPGRRERIEIAVAELARRRETVRRWKEGVDALVAVLPRDALGEVELFAGAPPEDVFADNCHLTSLGARLAGEAIAKRVAEVAEARRR